MSTSGAEPNQPNLLRSLRGLAESAARIGGDLALASFRQPQKVRLKADHSEVTDADIAAERAIVDHIRTRRPQDVFIGEESSSDEPDRQSSIINPQSLVWVIDPIDGTRNYVRNMPMFVCSVGAMREGVPLAGAIYDPVHGAMYSAARKQGFFVDGLRRPTRRSPATKRRSAAASRRAQTDAASAAQRSGAVADSSERCQLLIGIPSAQRPTTRQIVLGAVENHVVRNFGSAALHLAFVALGHLDAAVMGNGKLWDIAAGAILVSEAGGVVTSPDGSALFPIDTSRYAGEECPILAGSPTAHARLLREARTD